MNNNEKIATQASGEVNAFVQSASDGGIFKRIEYPTLRLNENVNKIIFLDKDGGLIK